MEKSKVTNARGQVPLKAEKRFIAAKNDSNIRIPIEFDFKEEITYYHSRTAMEALATVGGSTSLLDRVTGTLRPLLVLSFMLKLAQIILDRYDKQFKLELDSFIDHIVHMLTQAEEKFEQCNKHLQDPGITRKGRVPDIHLQRSIRRQRMTRYLKWFQQNHIGKVFDDEVKKDWVLEVDKECRLDHALMMIGEAVDAYKPYLTKLELEKEKRICEQYTARLELWHTRRNAALLATIKGLTSKVHFAGVMALHDNYEMRDLKTGHRF